MSVFILGPYLNNGDKEVWLSLSQVPIMIFIIYYVVSYYLL